MRRVAEKEAGRHYIYMKNKTHACISYVYLLRKMKKRKEKWKEEEMAEKEGKAGEVAGEEQEKE